MKTFDYIKNIITCNKIYNTEYYIIPFKQWYYIFVLEYNLLRS